MAFVNDLLGRRAAALVLACSLAASVLACLSGCTRPVSGGSATLIIHVEPHDSVIYVDCRCDYGPLCDNTIGSGVRSFRGLNAGVAVVRAEREGYETWEASIPVTPGENSVKVTLQRGDRGRLNVSSDVDGVEVYVDGALAGRTPLVGYMIAAGRHSLELVGSETRLASSVWGFGWGAGGGVPGDLTVVQASFAEGWTLIGYPPNRLATEYGSPRGWTPDGARVVFSGRGIKLVDMETLDVQDTGIMAWSTYGWSPDGNLLAFNFEGLAGVMKAGGSEVQTYRYADAGLPPWAPSMTSLVSWYPDGQHLLLQTGDSPVYWLLDLATGKGEPFMEGIRGKYSKESVTIHALMKDGDALVELRSFVRKDGRSGFAESGYFADIGILDGETADVRRLTQADEDQYYTPIGLTPDGRFAYFRLYDKRQGPEAATLTYGTVSLNDGAVRPVVRGEAGTVWAWWSPDGRQLLYVPERAGEDGARLMVAAADGTDPRVLFTVPNLGMDAEFSVAKVQWSGDGTQAWITDSKGLHWFARKHSPAK